MVSFCRQVGKETTRTVLRKLVLDDKDAFLRLRTQGRATADSSSDFFSTRGNSGACFIIHIER